MATAGSIVVDLLMRTGSFETDTRRAERQMRQLQRKIDRTVKRIGMYGLAVAGTFAAAMKSANNYMAEIGMAAERTSVSAEAFSGLAYAAKDASLSQGELERALRRSTEAINHGIKGGSRQAEALKTLGVSAYDAAGELKTADQMLIDLSERFSELEPGARKTGLVLDLFGQQLGQKVIPFLNKGREGIEELTNEARSFGLIVDNEAAQAADQFNANLNRMSSLIKGASVSLASEYLPVISKFVELSVEAARQTDEVLSSVQGLSNDYALPSWFKTALIGFGAVIDVVVALAKAVNVVILAFRAAFADIELLFAVQNKLKPWNWFSGDATKELEQSLESRNKKVAEFNQELVDLWTYDGTKLTRAAQEAIEWMEFQRGFVGPQLPTKRMGTINVTIDDDDDPRKPSRTSSRIDEGQRYIQQLHERIALLGKETEYERLLAQMSVGAINFKTQAQEQEAIAQAQTLDFLEEQMRAVEEAKQQAEEYQALMHRLYPEQAEYERFIADVELLHMALEDGQITIEQYIDAMALLEGQSDETFSAMTAMADMAFTSVGNSIADMLATGEADFKSFADGIVREMMRMMMQAMIIQPLMQAMGFASGGYVGGSTGGGSSYAPDVSGHYASGGYTGDGGKYEPAGIVHRGEYVFSKESVNRLGVGTLERLHRNSKGYASGGLVGGSAAISSPSVEVNIINKSGQPVSAGQPKVRMDNMGRMVVDVMLDDLRRNGPYARQLKGVMG